MERLVQNARAKMGVAETTSDGTYEKNRVFIKQFAEVTKTMTVAIQRASTAMSDAVHAIEQVQRAYDQMLGIGMHSPIASQASVDLGNVVADVRDRALPEYVSLLRAECLNTLASLEQDHSRVEALRQERKKAVDLFDYFKNEVHAKEREYQKKGKNLQESKTYHANCAKMSEAQKSYETIHSAFTTEIDALQRRKVHVVAHNMQCFMEHSRTLMGAMYAGLDHVFRLTSVNTHVGQGQYQQPAQHEGQQPAAF